VNQEVLTGIIAIVAGIVGCAIYIPKLFLDDGNKALGNGIRVVLFFLVLILGIFMVPYF
jgi:hypothetical protein